MIKKILILIIGFNTLAFGLSVFQSCGLLGYDAWICDMEFSYVYQETDTNQTDFGRIDFNLHGIYSCEQAFNTIQIDLIQSCLATTKCANWQNEIDNSSIQIIFDKRIVIENDTISGGENILENKNIDLATEIKIEDDCKFMSVKVSIAGETGRFLEFEEGVYSIIFRCSTSDNRDLDEEFEHTFNR